MKSLAVLAVAGVFIAGSSIAAKAQGAVAILLPGAGGPVPSDFLIRNQGSFSAAGIETAVATSPGEAVSLTAAQRQRGRSVVLVGMSRGASMAAAALASGAPASGVVFVSANLDAVTSRLGAPSTLPPTLVVHHRADACGSTPPEGVGRFTRWAGGRASVQWINTTGTPARNPCGPFGAHGFFTQDAPAVSAVLSFVRSK